MAKAAQFKQTRNGAEPTLALPRSEMGEKGLLSCVMQNTALLLEHESVIDDRLFQDPANMKILGAVRQMAPHFPKIDWETLRGSFSPKALEEIGGVEYLNEVFGFVPTPEGWEYYYQAAFRAEQLRSAKLAALEILKLEDPDEAAEIAEETLKAIAAPKIKPPVEFKERVHQTLEWIEQMATNPPQSVIRFGIDELDETLRPIEQADLATIGAPTSGGKSALASQAVLSSPDQRWAIFSAEMPARSLVARMFAWEAKVSLDDLRKGRLRKCDYCSVTDAAKILAQRNIWIEDEHPIDVRSIAAKCRQLKRKGLSAVIVDYLQLISPETSGKRDQSREREVAAISRSLKSLALELEIAVISLSQLNEAGQLRESRAIGQDSDIILLLHHSDDGSRIQVRKHRNGPERSIPVNFERALMRFSGVPKSTGPSRPVRLPYGGEAE